MKKRGKEKTILGGVYAVHELSPGVYDWGSIETLKPSARRIIGFVRPRDVAWVTDLTPHIKDEPLLTHYNDFVYLTRLAAGTFSASSAYAQAQKVIETLYAYNGMAKPENNDILGFFQTGGGNVGCLTVKCPPLATLFPEKLPAPTFADGNVACRRNPAYFWAESLLTTATVERAGYSVKLWVAPTSFCSGGGLSEAATAVISTSMDITALNRSLMRVAELGFAPANVAAIMHSPSISSRTAAALDPFLLADMLYYKEFDPAKLQKLHGPPSQPGYAVQTAQLPKTAADAMRMFKNAVAWVGLQPASHPTATREFVQSCRPSVGIIRPFVVGPLNDENILSVASTASTATVWDYFNTEMLYSPPVLNAWHCCGQAFMLMHVGKYQCHHSGWTTMRSALPMARTTGERRLCVFLDVDKRVFHFGTDPAKVQAASEWSVWLPVLFINPA